MSIYDIITEIRLTNGTNNKIAVLKKHCQDNDLLERVFNMTLSTEYVYGVKKIPEPLDECKSIFVSYPVTNLSDALDILEQFFATNEVTGDKRVYWLRDILSTLPKDDSMVLEMVIKGSLDCGVSTSNANKVLRNKIKTFKVMLCEKQTEKTMSKFDFKDAYAQLKSDGMRIIISVDDKTAVPTYRTRNGKELQFTDKYNAFFADHPGKVFDGEAVVVDKANNIQDRKTGNGILNSIRSGKASEDDTNSVRFLLWDVFSYDEFFSVVEPTAPYSERMEELQEMAFDDSVARLIDSIVINSAEEAQEYYIQMRKNGEEGIVIKEANSVFAPKRVKSHIKLKAVETADLLVTDIFEGQGERSGMMGAIECQTADGLLKVNVGSGFTRAQCQEFWNNKDSILNKVVECQYNEIIQSKQKESKSLFLPIFVELRLDKDQANTLLELA